MSICCKAQSRGLGRTTAHTLPRYDSCCKLREKHRVARFCTSTSLRASGIEPVRNGKKSYAKERQRAERDELTRLLKESPGKRDARNFLKHFDSPAPKPATPTKADTAVSEVVERARNNEWRLTKTGVNLGNLYEPTKAIQDSPVFTQQELPEKAPKEKELEPLHLALVKLRQPQALDDETLGGIALTLGQMARLGLNIAVVVDCDADMAPDNLELSPAWEAQVREQCSRIVDALEEYNDPGAFEVDHALCYSDVDMEIPSTVQIRGGVEVKNNHLLFPPIEDGIIPVIPPFAYDAELKKVRVQADDVVLALTREFAGLGTQHLGETDAQELDDALYGANPASQGRPILDRIIILDPLGGIPAHHRADGAHVFINLEAEYHDVKKDLQRLQLSLQNDASQSPASLSHTNPFSQFVETEVASLPGSTAAQTTNPTPASRHTKNLEVVHNALRLLPPSSSALIITPTEAATSSQAAHHPTPSPGVRTRRSKNPLIHNLLTDKPMISSSLPAPFVNRPPASASPNAATFLKKGIPVTLIPDPRTTGPWRPPSPSHPSISLENDPRINFPRLVDLIEDSFRRKLDAAHYLARIRGRVAGLIIAGDYEGGAICTWETPPPPPSLLLPPNPPPDDSSPLWIPYLDKFAVLTSSQGSGGVADIVWGALTRACFPGGLVWRSRKTNPVNKWYFERAVGMWNLPDGYWTMFWTTEGVVQEWGCAERGGGGEGKGSEGGEEMTRWDAYVKVCESVKPSWVDAGKPD